MTIGETDRNLIEKAKTGDEGAFRQLFEIHSRRVLSVAYGVLRNIEQAQEVTQETFIKAFKNLHLFDYRSSFYTWLYRIAVNSAIDARRKKGWGLGVSYDEAIEVQPAPGYDSLAASIPRPDVAVEGRDAEARIHKALGELPESQRLAVMLKDVEDLSYQEIAEVMQCSIGTVMSRIHYGRRRLQELIRGRE